MRYRDGILAIAIVAGFLIMLTFLNGCAVGMAASGKRAKDTTVLMGGTPRERVLAEFGAPESSVTNENGELVDTWVIVKGNEPSALRAVLHGLLDVGTFGLWEVIGTPVEMIAAKEDKYRYIVTYNKNNTVKTMQALPLEKEKRPTAEPSKKEKRGTAISSK